MLQAVFAALMGSALLWGLMRGEGAAVAMAMLEAAREAVNTALSLAGAFGLFCGNPAQWAGLAAGSGPFFACCWERDLLRKRWKA